MKKKVDLIGVGYYTCLLSGAIMNKKRGNGNRLFASDLDRFDGAARKVRGWAYYKKCV